MNKELYTLLIDANCERASHVDVDEIQFLWKYLQFIAITRHLQH